MGKIEVPPLGLEPRFVHDKRRIRDIDDAILRFISAGSEVPIEWVEERNELLQRTQHKEKW